MKKIIVLVASLFASSTFAAESAQSEFFHQAVQGKHEVIAGVLYRDGKFESSSQKIDFDWTTLSAQYEYGFSEIFSVGVLLNYTVANVDQNPKTKSSGLEDLQVFLKGKQTLGTGLRYGAFSSIALEDGEIKANGDSNTATGGIKIAPYIGYEWTLETGVIGARISHEIRLQDDKNVDKSSTPSITQKSDGDELTVATAFYEHSMNENLTLGGSVEYRMSTDTKYDDGPKTDGEKTTTLAVYAPLGLGSGTFIPRVAYGDGETSGLDWNYWEVGARYRMEF